MILHDPQSILRDEIERALDVGLVGAWYCVGVGDGDGLRGVMAFDHIRRDDCEMHAAGIPGFMTPGLLRECGRVVFDVLGCQRVTIRVRKSNIRLQRAAERAGFKHEGWMRRFFGDEDAALMGLLASEYPYHVQRQQTPNRSCA